MDRSKKRNLSFACAAANTFQEWSPIIGVRVGVGGWVGGWGVGVDKRGWGKEQQHCRPFLREKKVILEGIIIQIMVNVLVLPLVTSLIGMVNRISLNPIKHQSRKPLNQSNTQSVSQSAKSI